MSPSVLPLGLVRIIIIPDPLIPPANSSTENNAYDRLRVQMQCVIIHSFPPTHWFPLNSFEPTAEIVVLRLSKHYYIDFV